MNDQELADLVLRFAGEMNALQRRYAPLLEKAREHNGTAACAKTGSGGSTASGSAFTANAGFTGGSMETFNGHGEVPARFFVVCAT